MSVTRRRFLQVGASLTATPALASMLPAPRVVRYGPHASQVATLHLPVRRRPPVVCLLHGGFWSMPYGADQMTPLAEDLARRGVAAWNVEYRRLGDGGGYPQTLDDVAAAISQLERLEGVALDLDRVVAVGHSAGGHLALWAAAQPRLKLAGACGQAPVADLEASWRLSLGRGVVERFMGGSPTEVPTRYRAASPRALLPERVPQLVVHGEDDDLVPIAMSRDYVATARATRLHAVPGGGHFEHLDPLTTEWRAVVDWLRSLGLAGTA